MGCLGRYVSPFFPGQQKMEEKLFRMSSVLGCFFFKAWKVRPSNIRKNPWVVTTSYNPTMPIPSRNLFPAYQRRVGQRHRVPLTLEGWRYRWWRGWDFSTWVDETPKFIALLKVKRRKSEKKKKVPSKFAVNVLIPPPKKTQVTGVFLMIPWFNGTILLGGQKLRLDWS